MPTAESVITVCSCTTPPTELSSNSPQPGFENASTASYANNMLIMQAYRCGAVEMLCCVFLYENYPVRYQRAHLSLWRSCDEWCWSVCLGKNIYWSLCYISCECMRNSVIHLAHHIPCLHDPKEHQLKSMKAIIVNKSNKHVSIAILRCHLSSSRILQDTTNTAAVYVFITQHIIARYDCD